MSNYKKSMKRLQPTLAEVILAAKNNDLNIFPAQVLVDGREWFLSSKQVATVLEVIQELQEVGNGK